MSWHRQVRFAKIPGSCPLDQTRSSQCLSKVLFWLRWVQIWTSQGIDRGGRGRSDLMKSTHPTQVRRGKVTQHKAISYLKWDVLTPRDSLTDWMKLDNIGTLGQRSQRGNLITIIPYQRHFPRDTYFRSHNTWNLKSCTSGLESVGISDIRY